MYRAQPSIICSSIKVWYNERAFYMNKPAFTTDILILGAGIGGYETFRTLKNQLAKHGLKKQITIVDQNNYFTFTPLLHEVASGSVEPSHATVPLREIVYRTHHRFLKARIKKIIADQKIVETDVGAITYDYCVVALGSGVHFYSISGAEKYTYNVRTLPEAMRLRTDLIRRIESCENETTVTIVGGGYTGVEVAGQLADLVRHDVDRLYPDDSVVIKLVQVGPVLVPSLPARAQRLILKRLTKLGVKVVLDSGVKEVKKDSVVLVDDTEHKSNLTVWCAGVGNLAGDYMPPNTCERGRLPVTEFLTHPSFPSLYGVGDIVCGQNPGSTVPFPQLGEAAHKEGEYVAKHIIASMGHYHLAPFRFNSLGTLMPIGEGYGLLIKGKFVMSGIVIWWVRRWVYIMFMPGIVRKLKIISDWTLRKIGFRYIIDIEQKK